MCSFVGVGIVFNHRSTTRRIEGRHRSRSSSRSSPSTKDRQEDLEFSGVQDHYQEAQELLRAFPEHHERLKYELFKFKIYFKHANLRTYQERLSFNISKPLRSFNVIAEIKKKWKMNHHDCHRDHLLDQHQHPTNSLAPWFPQDDQLLDCHHQTRSGKGIGGKPLMVNLVDKNL